MSIPYTCLLSNLQCLSIVLRWNTFLPASVYQTCMWTARPCLVRPESPTAFFLFKGLQLPTSFFILQQARTSSFLLPWAVVWTFSAHLHVLSVLRVLSLDTRGPRSLTAVLFPRGQPFSDLLAAPSPGSKEALGHRTQQVRLCRIRVEEGACQKPSHVTRLEWQASENDLLHLSWEIILLIAQDVARRMDPIQESSHLVFFLVR